MGELLQRRHRQQGVPGDRQLHRCAVAPVVTHQAPGQAMQGRDLSTLAPLRALRARTPNRAWARHAVGEGGVRSCPRAGCGRAACPVRRAGCGNGVTATPLRHRQTKEAETDMCSLKPPRHISTPPFAPFWLCLDVRFAPNNDRMANIRKRSKRAMTGLMHGSKTRPATPGTDSTSLFHILVEPVRNDLSNSRAILFEH